MGDNLPRGDCAIDITTNAAAATTTTAAAASVGKQTGGAGGASVAVAGAPILRPSEALARIEELLAQQHLFLVQDPNLAPTAKLVPGSEYSIPAGETSTVEKWDRSLSDQELQFTADDTTARRPGGASSYPASLVSIPSSCGSISLTAVLTQASTASNAMSFGIARRGFRKSGTSGFGGTSGSWGINENNRATDSGGCILSYGGSSKEEKRRFRKMKQGDVFCLRYERALGRAWLFINGSELVQEFKIHEPGESDVELVLGATYCNDHELKIVAEAPPDLPTSAP